MPQGRVEKIHSWPSLLVVKGRACNIRPTFRMSRHISCLFWLPGRTQYHSWLQPEPQDLLFPPFSLQASHPTLCSESHEEGFHCKPLDMSPHDCIIVVATFLFPMTKYLTNQFKEGRAWWGARGGRSHCYAIRKQRMGDVRAQLSFMYSPGFRPMGWYHPHLEWGFLPKSVSSKSWQAHNQY